MKQLYCKHYIKEAKKTSGYTYPLINAELNLCKNCEKKLFKKMKAQHDIEEMML
jgi:hypothetical protein